MRNSSSVQMYSDRRLEAPAGQPSARRPNPLAVAGRLPLALLVASLGLAACQSTPPEGRDLGFVQDVMEISAELSEGPERAEPAVRAVEDWRGGGDGN